MPEAQKIKPISPEISQQPISTEQPIEGEKIFEKEEESSAQTQEAAESSRTPTSKQSTAVSFTDAPSLTVIKKSEVLQVIEEILEEDLEEAYWQMPPNMREEFKRRGEDTAKKIERLLAAVHLNILKVLRLLQKWLSIIPHINSFFLEQEAKIKADKIITLHREQKKNS